MTQSAGADSQPPIPQAADTQNLSYEAARDQLVEVVRQLESGGVPLSESMALWQRGEQLAQVCQNWLDGARQTIAEARQVTTDAGPSTGVQQPSEGRQPAPARQGTHSEGGRTAHASDPGADADS